MTTEVVVKVDPTGSGHFTTLTAAETALRTNLVSSGVCLVFEIYGGGSVGPAAFDSANWTTGPSNYIQIRAAAGHEHQGVFNANKALIKNTAAVDTCLSLTRGWVRIGPGVQFDYGGYGTSASNVVAIDMNLAATNEPIYVDRSIFTTSAGKNVAKSIYVRGHACDIAHKSCVSNCLFIDRTSHCSQVIRQAVGQLYVFGNTMVADNNADHPVCLYTDTGGAVMVEDNNYLKGGWANYFVPAGTITKGTHTATHNQEATTASLSGVLFTTANFVSVTSGSENLHLTAGSALRKKGVPTYVMRELGLNVFPSGLGKNQWLNYNGKVYSIGGITSAAESAIVKKVWSSSDLETWAEVGDLPIALQDFGACVHDNKMWVAGGGWTNSSYSRKVFWSSDGETWTEAGTNALPSGLISNTLTSFNGKLYCIAGTPSTAVGCKTIWSSDDGITWTEESYKLPHNLASHTSAVHNNQIFIIGGDDAEGWQSQAVYKTSDGTNWSEVGDDCLPAKMFFQGVVSYKGLLWLIGGWWDSHDTTSKNYYSADNGATWTQVMRNDLPYIYFSWSTVLFNNHIYTMLGSNEATYNQKIYKHEEPNEYDIDGKLRPWYTIDIGADQYDDSGFNGMLSNAW